METFLSQNIALLCQRQIPYALVGDFNQPSPHVGGYPNHHLFNYPFSQPLIDLIADYVMLQLLPSGIPTPPIQQYWQLDSADNVLGTEGTLNAQFIQKDDILIPIGRRNFSKWPKLSQGHHVHHRSLCTSGKPCPQSNDGGTRTLTNLRKQVMKLSRKSHQMRGLPDHPCQWEHKTLLRTGVASPATVKRHRRSAGVLTMSKENKVKVQGTRSEYDQGFSLKKVQEVSARIETKLRSA
ncbi:hypothetical protein BDR07DRAFT_1497159 [Suillus spraguei]|nr:hypothetical protein BDR07DRAFT_1497159 [Suillus spraguei]